MAHLQRARFPEHFCPWSFFFSFPPSSCSLCRVTGSLARHCRSLLKSQTFFRWLKKGVLIFFRRCDLGRITPPGLRGLRCVLVACFPPPPSSAPPTAPGAGRNRTRFKLQTAALASSTSPSRSAAAHGRVCFLRETCCKKRRGHASGLHRPVFTQQCWTVRDPAQVRDACALFTLADCALNFGQLLPADHLRKENSAPPPLFL